MYGKSAEYTDMVNDYIASLEERLDNGESRAKLDSEFYDFLLAHSRISSLPAATQLHELIWSRCGEWTYDRFDYTRWTEWYNFLDWILAVSLYRVRGVDVRREGD